MLPAPVREVCATFLDACPPVFVTGLYLRGGLGFGEWIVGQSDVDFVATLAHRPSLHEVEALRRVHAALADRCPGLAFDGMHVLVTDLAADPADLPPVPTVLAGRFDPAGRLDPEVAWAELATAGLTVTGPELTSLPVSHSPASYRDFTLRNLDSYWRGVAQTLVATPAGTVTASDCTWCVLGVARLDHVLVTGGLTTKSGAGRWGLTHYPMPYRRVLREALRLREGGVDQYDGDAAARGRDTTAFVTYVVDAALARGPV